MISVVYLVIKGSKYHKISGDTNEMNVEALVMVFKTCIPQSLSGNPWEEPLSAAVLSK